MPLNARRKHEKIEAWRNQAEGELARLQSLSEPELSTEVLRRGFADLPADGERTRIGLSNSLCPEAPAVVGGNDIDIIQQYGALLAPVLGVLEATGLLASEPRGRSGLAFYRLTDLGRASLADGGGQASRSTSSPA